MEWWHAIILGVVEGITEYLPISSTGHLILASSLLGLGDESVKSSVDAFNIVIQGGAILAVLGLYRARVVQMIRGLFGRDAVGRRLLINLIVAFLPAFALGPFLHDPIQRWLFHPWPVLTALFLGGLWMIWLDRRGARRVSARLHEAIDHEHERDAEAPRHIRLEEITWRTALLIGLFQVVAMWPGTSRSMMTIAGGTLLGVRPRDAAEFSFLLGLPTLGGATVYQLGKNLLLAEDGGTMFAELGAGPIVLGVVFATLSAAMAVKWLVAFLNRHGLGAFGWYRIALCAVLGGLILAGLVQIG